MSHKTLTADLQDWLTGKALADPDIAPLFETLCNRINAAGIPLERAVLSWATLHPLFRAELLVWRNGAGTELEQYPHSVDTSDEWKRSPLNHAMEHNLSAFRRQLTGPNALLDFDVLHEFADEGYTDYVVTRTAFRLAEVKHFAQRETGMMASWMTRRPGGFTDDDLDALQTIQKIFAVACHASIQKRVMANVTTAYLGPTAGKRVLSGDIRRNDGDMIPAVVWFSDLRGSTRLSDTMDPDSYLQLVNRYFECTAQPVIDHGGEILNFIGDGVMAIFPIEDSCPKDASARAEAAARDALDRREAAIAEGTPGNAPLNFGIGLAIGDVMFGNIGVPSRLAFSAIGKIVNTVQRVEAATKTVGCPVLALKRFAESAPGNWVSCGTFEIQDFDKRLTAYTLEHLRTDQRSAPATDALETPAE